MKLAIGFITYNSDTAKYLPYFLDSLFKSLEFLKKDDFLVLARDNSDDPDNYNREYIEDIFNKTEKLIDFKWSGENAGFAKSYNKMIDEAIIWGADFFLVINPDTIVSPEAIFKLTLSLKSDNSLASVSPKILRWDFENLKLTDVIDTCGIALGSGLSFFDIAQGEIDNSSFYDSDILGPSGAAGLYRISSLVKIKDENGYFDNRMFMYKEDCDLAYRLYLSNFKSKLIPEAIVYHDRTVSKSGKGIFSALNSRLNKSKNVRSWSFLNQHLIFAKFWRNQSFFDKLLIIIKIIVFMVFALFKEPFLLKNYSKISQIYKKTLKA
jgi:N-acetylglucosaminyl-diphospho-decaprenol L-rhamnosyltransferase